MNKKELKNNMEVYLTKAKAMRQLKKYINFYGENNVDIYVRCCTINDWEEYNTDLVVELETNEGWFTITVASITIKESGDFYEFIELTKGILRTMKINLIKEISKHYKIFEIDDYHV